MNGKGLNVSDKNKKIWRETGWNVREEAVCLNPNHHCTVEAIIPLLHRVQINQYRSVFRKATPNMKRYRQHMTMKLDPTEIDLALQLRVSISTEVTPMM